MHIVSGLILAALFKGSSTKRSPLLNLCGVVETVHLLPGRVRFRVAALVGNRSGQQAVNEQIPKIEGVKSITINPISGSVLIYYQNLDPELLVVALVRILHLEKELEHVSQPLLARELRELASSCNRIVYDMSHGIVDLWTTLPLLLGMVGAYKVVIDKQTRFPGGVTLLWWAYLHLIRQR